MKDQLFSKPLDAVPPFEFNTQVAQVFPDMLQRSIPGYTFLIQQLGWIASQYAQPKSHYYDLGCSLGITTLAMAQHIQLSDCTFLGVDQSQAMIEKCRNHSTTTQGLPIEWMCADITQMPITNAAVVILNFTLQFIPPSERQKLIQKIYEGLKPKGILILSEKICFPDAARHDAITDLHHGFKAKQGYSQLEISQKRTALENILVPETQTAHENRLKSAGFSLVLPWFQAFNFVSWIAQK